MRFITSLCSSLPLRQKVCLVIIAEWHFVFQSHVTIGPLPRFRLPMILIVNQSSTIFTAPIVLHDVQSLRSSNSIWSSFLKCSQQQKAATIILCLHFIKETWWLPEFVCVPCGGSLSAPSKKGFRIFNQLVKLKWVRILGYKIHNRFVYNMLGKITKYKCAADSARFPAITPIYGKRV